LSSMKSAKLISIVPALSILVHFATWGWGQEHVGPTVSAAGSNTVNVTGALITNMVNEWNSAASGLFDLAGERFAAVEKRHEVWVMTLHSANESLGVIKYTDGKITVVALPVINPKDETGLRRYVDAYNRYNLRSADLKVKQGRYSEAQEMYTVLSHFDPRGSLAEGVSRRLQLLERIESGKDKERDLKEFMDLYTDWGPSFMAGMDDAAPVAVKNLLEVRIR
jgi:hypothetical protein